MLIFKVLGSWVRGLYFMGFGAFWLFMSYYLSRSGAMGANSAMTTMGGIGALALVSGLIVIARGIAMTNERSTLPKGSTGWRDDGNPAVSDTGFDADAAIARYIQNRPAAADAPVAEAAPQAEPAAAPRPTFGRKQV
jgi:hypothetical protein